MIEPLSDPGKAPTKALIGASIPRSGHHFLQTLLSRYFGEEMFYCEVYTRPDCCKSTPCLRRGGHLLTYQKSHDRQGEVPKDIADALYVLQYREPVSEALSDRELDLIDHIGRRSLNYRLSSDHYTWWLAAKAVYYRDFHDKWFSPRLENAVYLDYAFLSTDPSAAIEVIAQSALGRVDRQRVESAVEQTSATRAGATRRWGDKTYVPRKVEDSPYFDRDLLGAFEAYVLSRCPNYGFEPKLRGAFVEHPFYGVVLLHDVREPLPPGETNRLQAAAKRAPNHPDIVLRLARNHLEANEPERAIAALEALLERNPYFGGAYKPLFAAYAQAGRPVPAERFGGEALLACADSPSFLTEIAVAYLASKMTVSAVAALSLATTLEPQNFRANFLLAKTLADERKWAQAQRFAEQAAALKPKGKLNLRLLARIGKQLGRNPVHLMASGETEPA